MNVLQKFIPQYTVVRLFFCCVSIILINPIVAQKNFRTTRFVDSLNELAFQQKRFNVSESFNSLIVTQNTATQINYKKGLAVSYLYEGGIYQQQGFTKRAITDYYLALDIFRRIKDTFNIAKTNYQIASALLLEEKLTEAASLFRKSFDIYTLLNKEEELANIKNGLGLVNLKKERLDSAIIFFRDAFRISKKIKYQYGEKKALYHLGMAAFIKHEYSISKSFLNQSLDIDIQLNDQFGKSCNLLKLAEIDLKGDNFASALALSKQSYFAAKSINAYGLIETSINQIIANYRLQNNTKMAIIWQDSAILELNKRRKTENEYAANFIEVIKKQQVIRLDGENAMIRAEKASDEQLSILTAATFTFIVMGTLSVLVFIYYQRQRMMSIELRTKNVQIEKQIVHVKSLNEEIFEQNKLLEADIKTKNKLLSIISHDLRTPLVNTKGILNLVNQGIVPEDQSKQLLIQLESQYMGTTSLLDNLLFWLKGQMAGKNIEKNQVHIFQLVKGLESEHHMLLERKKISFNIAMEPELQIIADKEMTRIILRNLISNAIKFTPINGIISVSAIHEDGISVLKVSDSGIGMSQATIDKINAKQYYTTAGTNMEKGSGFGLMLCSDLINRHGGSMSITSVAGTGSTFIITLPS